MCILKVKLWRGRFGYIGPDLGGVEKEMVWKRS